MKEQIHIYINKTLKTEVKKKAKQKGISITSYINSLILKDILNKK